MSRKEKKAEVLQRPEKITLEFRAVETIASYLSTRPVGEVNEIFNYLINEINTSLKPLNKPPK